MINLDDVSYRYAAGMEALSHVSAELSPGIYLLLGENGAGKTTLLHIIAGLLFPTTGSCTIDSEAPMTREPSVLNKVFILPDNLAFPQSTLNRFVAEHSRFYPTFNPDMLAENLEEFGLTGNERFRSLSLGNKRKSLIAYALALGTEVLLLDEPANGLDIGSKQILKRMIARNIGENRTLIVSTHIVSDLETLYDGVMMLRRSNLILSMPTAELQSRISFVCGPVPPVNALYYAQGAGVFHSIVPCTNEEETAIDFNLLYMGMQSNAADSILEILKTERYDKQ